MDKNSKICTHLIGVRLVLELCNCRRANGDALLFPRGFQALYCNNIGTIIFEKSQDCIIGLQHLWFAYCYQKHFRFNLSKLWLFFREKYVWKVVISPGFIFETITIRTDWKRRLHLVFKLIKHPLFIRFCTFWHTKKNHSFSPLSVRDTVYDYHD